MDIKVVEDTGQLITCVFCERSNKSIVYNLAFANIDEVIGCFNCWNNVAELLFLYGTLTMQDRTADIVKILIADSEP